MTSLSSTAEQILELFDQDRKHPDPSVSRGILKTDIEDLIYRSEAVQELKSEIEDLDREKRQLEREIEELEIELAD